MASGLGLSSLDEIRETREEVQQPRDPASGRFKPLVGAGGEHWVLGDKITKITVQKSQSGYLVNTEENISIALLQAHVAALGEVRCDACSGYGHTLAVCPCYARML